MGWANCGEDSNGRPIGYAHLATCDEPGCKAKIDRGLSYACGGMHGDCGGQACEKYFCTDHLYYIDQESMGLSELSTGQLCNACLENAKKELTELIAAGDLVTIDPDELKRLRSAPDPTRAALEEAYRFIDGHVHFSQPNYESGLEPSDQFSAEAAPLLAYLQRVLGKTHAEISDGTARNALGTEK